MKFFYISKKNKNKNKIIEKKGKGIDTEKKKKKIHSPFQRIQITKIENLNAVKPHI